MIEELNHWIEEVLKHTPNTIQDYHRGYKDAVKDVKEFIADEVGLMDYDELE